MDPPQEAPFSGRSPSATSNATGRSDQDDLSNTMKQMSLSQDRRSSTNTPGTPTAPHAPLTPNSARRPSSSLTLRQSASSPRLTKRSSRSSLGGASPHHNQDDNEKRPTPKKSISNLISGLREAQAQSSMESIAEPVRLTAPDIAKVHFARELARLETADSETLVVLHDACYGHRFSRPRTSKSSLSMIVERPERLHAGVLGAATAFVRMGGHYEGQTNAPTMEGEVQDGPPFRIRRTARTLDVTSSYVTNVHGTAWMKELTGMCNFAGERLARGEKELARDSTTDGGEKRTLHEGDLYLCSESLNAFQGAMGGVADAIDSIFAPEVPTRRAFVAVRPPGHHCSADYPSGFCWLNNVHVGLEYAAQTYGLTHAAIIDFDLHHGDGSQSIAWDRNSKNNIKRMTAKPNSKQKLGPDIGYYSLHDINSYPCESGDDEKVQAASLCIENAHGQSIWNVHLQTWKTEDEFWHLYESRYKVLLEKARGFLRHHTSRLRAEGKVQPKAAIFISAGFDASEWEGAGMQRHKVNVPTEFYARFTRDMVQLAQEEGSGCDGRVISVLEGGYSDRALCSGVLSHLSGLSMPSSNQQSDNSFGLDQHMMSLSLQNGARHATYDTQWWSPENLTALEMKVNPPPPAAPGGKKFRTGQQPTYATPTESFAYKVHDPQKFARSISGTMRESPTTVAREPTPPPPEIDWVVATQELTKLLIPQDRQTKSCTAEELAGPKKVVVAPSATEREQAERPRQLRTRAKPNYRENPDEISRADRRRTIGDLPSSTEPVPAPAPAAAKRSSRRSSMASTLSSGPPDTADDVPPVPPITTTANGMPPPPIPANAVGDVQVKKTRAPPKLKKAAVAASAPVSPVASFKRQPPPLSDRAPPQPAEAQSPTTSSAPKGFDAMSPNSGMDALTKGLKKVTLKVGTREEHDKKMKDRLDSERRARALKGAETRRVNKAAREAKLAEPKPTPAQRAKLGPEIAREEASKPAVAAQEVVPQASAHPIPAFTEPQAMQKNVVTVAPSQMESAVQPQSDNPQIAQPTPAIPQFNIPVYEPPPSTNVPAPAPAPAAPPPPPSPTSLQPNPVPSIHQQPQQLQQLQQQQCQQFELSTTESQLQPQSRQPSYTSLYRFVPVMNEASPPTSRPITAARAASYPEPPPEQSVSKPSQADHSASTKNAAAGDRPLPVFSATGPIPFAAPANAAGSGEVPGDVAPVADAKSVESWEISETPDKR